MLVQLWGGLKHWQKWTLALVAAYVLLALLVLWVVSPLVRQPVVNAIAEATGRTVEIDKLALNPLNWSLRIQGFRLLDTDAEHFVSFDEFYINFQISSLLRRSWHFDSIQLHAPRGRVVQLAPGQFNFDDLLASDEQPEPEVASAPLSIPAVSFRELVLSDGDFRFRDISRTEPQELVLSPLSFEIRDFSTRSDGDGGNFYAFKVEGPAGGRLEWEGSVAVEPLVLQGEMALSQVDITPFADFVQDQLNFSLSSALLDIRGRYRFEQENDNLFELQDGELKLTNLQVHERHEKTADPVISLPQLHVSGVALSTATSRVDVRKVLVDGLAAALVLESDGTNLERLFTPLTPEAPESITLQTEQDEVEIPTQVTDAVELAEEGIARQVEQGWYAVLQELTLQNSSLTLTDSSLSSDAPHLTLQPISASVQQFDSRGEAPLNFSATLDVASGGNLQLSGDGTLVPLLVRAETTLSGWQLAMANPWITQQLNASLQSGTLNSALQLTVQEQDAAMDIQVSGNTEISDFNFRETGDAPIMSFQQLALENWTLDAVSQAFSADRIVLGGLTALMSIDERGVDLATRLEKAAAAGATADSTPATTSDSPLPPMKIGSIVLQNANLSYVDRSLSPTFRASLNNFGGRIAALNSSSAAPAQVNFEGLVDRLSPLKVQGELGIFGASPDVNLSFSLDGYEMTRLAPYTGQFLGFGVDSGQLTVGSSIRIRNQHLDSRSDVKADKFFLGESVPSEEAVKVPIKLGLAILRDRNGLISLPVNAGGDLNDPSVSVTGIILKTLTNILVRAATSPFSLIGGLMGDSDQQHILFQEGGVQLAENSAQTLDALARALQERPTLLLNLTGSSGGEDRRQLAERDLLRELEVARDVSREMALQERRVQRAVNRLYENTLSADADTLLDDSIAEREARQLAQSQKAFEALLAHRATELPVSRLQELAGWRANEVKRYLVEQHEVPGDRVFITGGSATTDLPAVELELGAR